MDTFIALGVLRCHILQTHVFLIHIYVSRQIFYFIIIYDRFSMETVHSGSFIRTCGYRSHEGGSYAKRTAPDLRRLAEAPPTPHGATECRA